jgi:hypothetical protein
LRERLLFVVLPLLVTGCGMPPARCASAHVAAANGQWEMRERAGQTLQRAPPPTPPPLELAVGEHADVSSWRNLAKEFQLAASRPPSLAIFADDPTTTPDAIASKPIDESLFSLDYWKLVGSDIKQTFTAPARWDTSDWVVAGGVAGLIGVTFAFDQDIRNLAQHNNSKAVDNVLDALEPFGAAYSLITLGAFYVGGEVFHDPNAKATALDGFSASIIASGLIVQPLKWAVGRSRPNEDNGPYDFNPFGGNQSFPSGHATQAFTVATVISRHYPSPWVRVTCYGLATSVGLARINNDAHWGSDVVAGAAIGTFVGNVVVDVNEHHRQQISITPMTNPEMKGVMITWEH